MFLPFVGMVEFGDTTNEEPRSGQHFYAGFIVILSEAKNLG
jgi:hypothetical protein